jgi:PAS domain S-box-containing protein
MCLHFKKILSFLLLSICLFATRAQVYNFRNYNIDEGLSQSQVTDIIQDKNGFIWIGTTGGGINIFDGKKFTPITTDEGLINNVIWNMFCDSKGRVWIGTQSGLSLFDGSGFKSFNSYHGLMDDGIWKIIEDRHGNIWIATYSNGVTVYDGINFKTYGINDGLGFSNVTTLFEDYSGTIWAGSAGYGIARFNGKKFENITISHNLNAKTINHISQDESKNLLLYTDKGIFKLQGERFIESNYKELSGVNVIMSKTDLQGNLWVATEDKGVFLFNKSGSKYHFTEENGLPSNYILCLFVDKDNNVWFGTDGSGFCLFKGLSFIKYDKNSGLPDNQVNAIYKDSKNNMWFGTNNGIALYKNHVFTYFFNEKMHPQRHINSIYEDRSGNMWFGTENGVLFYDSRQWKIYSENEQHEIGQIHFIYQHSKNKKIWAATGKGLYEFNGKNFYKKFKDTIPPIRIYSIRELSDGRLFLSTEKGLTICNNNTVKHIKIKDELGSKDALDCLEDKHGNIWFATGRGLTVWKKDNGFKTYRKKDGLISDNIFFVFFSDQYLWVGTDRGLDRIKTNKDAEIKQIKNYGKHEGFTGIECNVNAWCMDDNRSFWIGSIKGAYLFNSEEEKEKRPPPVVNITNIRINYDNVDWKTKLKDTEIKNNLPLNPSFNYTDNHITFDFVALNYANPEKIKYQFYLKGFDEKWLPETDANSVTYSNLSPGNYTFMLRACDDHDNWSENITYPFSISAPFWRKTGFYLMLLPLMIIMGYAYTVYRTRQLSKSKRQLEEKVRLRTLELNKQKDELEKLSLVAAKMNDGVIICNPDGKIEYINNGFYKMAGYTEDEYKQSAYGKCEYLQQLSSYKDIDKIINAFKINNSPVIYESAHITASGKKMWTRGALTPVYNEKNQLVKIVAVYADITEKINFEAALEQKNKDFTDSVIYAKRIQEAILPSPAELYKAFNDSFLLYKPRDIVSGDFYWFGTVNDVFICAVADCTGHGVPGAFMSLIGNEFLHQVVNNSFITGPDQILFLLDKQITRALHQSGDDKETKDGMDIGLCVFHKNNFCQFAGAHIPLYLVRNNEIIEMDAQKESIGGYKDLAKNFYAHEFTLQKNDCIYMTTDGYLDQFSGEQGKKFMKKRFKELLLSINNKSMSEQKKIMNQEIETWKEHRKQTDDILVIGIKI